jgi:hypothetical protein
MGREADGDVIENYYPRVIEDATFYKAQDMIARRNKRGGGKGRRGKAFPNLLIGLGRCETCGGTLILGSRANSKAVRHFRCYQEGRKKDCDNTTRYLATDVEDRLMTSLVRAKMSEDQNRPDTAALGVKVGQIAQLKSRMEILLDQLEEGIPGVADRLKARQAELSELEREAAELRSNVEKRSGAKGSENLLKAFEWWEAVQVDEPEVDVYLHRAKANALLNDLFDFVMPTADGLYVGAGQQGWWIGDVDGTDTIARFAMPEGERVTRLLLDAARGALETFELPEALRLAEETERALDAA